VLRIAGKNISSFDIVPFYNEDFEPYTDAYTFMPGIKMSCYYANSNSRYKTAYCAIEGCENVRIDNLLTTCTLKEVLWASGNWDTDPESTNIIAGLQSGGYALRSLYITADGKNLGVVYTHNSTQYKASISLGGTSTLI
jgi:hypothetical protein